MLTDAEYIAIANAAADKRGIPQSPVYRGEFVRTYVKMRKIDDANDEHRARFATEPMPHTAAAWEQAA